MSAIRILANDGIDPTGKEMLEKAGFEVVTTRVEQDDLPTGLQEYDAIIVRSATKVRKELIDQCPRLKVIARAGVGTDNIDVAYARSKDLAVYNTPAASSQSVAELVFAHIFSVARFLHHAHRDMPVKGNTAFKGLKKAYSAGLELRGKTIGIIGVGRIGQAVARLALGMGIQVLAVDPFVDTVEIKVEVPGSDQTVSLTVETESLDEVLPRCDFLTLHVPSQDTPVIGKAQLERMKDTAIVVNASRGGVVDEQALIAALNAGKIFGAGLDVFAGEPTPDPAVLAHPKISLSPHIGASTDQAQANIGIELADKIIAHFA
jgi:D-3-phosphoglycerate dehydrogenase